MAALPNRDELESRLLRALGRAGNAAARRILDALGPEPDLTALTPAVWAEIEEAYSAALLPALEGTFVAGAEALMESAGIGVDWTLVNERAADWARRYSFDLIRGLNDRSRALVQRSVSDFYATGMTNRDLRDRLARTFGERRASQIAITEVTRASVEGERALVREIEAAGLKLVAVWNTANDDRTCDICGPRHGHKHGDGWTDFPPAHVGCRCWVNHEPEGAE